MAPKRSEKKPPPTPTSATTADAPSKSSRVAWKQGDQLEYMLSHWESFVTNQNEKKLDRFWPRVYDGWYKKWPITPSLESIGKYGSRENAILALRSENNNRIRTWFHNHGRPSAKSAKSDLRLSQNEKRKLAPVQAYCAYAWDSGLRDTVIARWEEQKPGHVSADDDDPVADAIGTPGTGSHIPINFKLKVVREVYNSLSAEEKKEIDERREEERKKMYRSIPEIKSGEERDKKLLKHQSNQSSVAKSMIRVLKNLEDQAGCVAHLFVGYVDPQTGRTAFQNFCQGKTESGLEFDEYYGDKWEDLVEKRFKDWALGIFGERDTMRRSMFILSDPMAASQSQSTVALEEFTEHLPEADTTVLSEEEIPPSLVDQRSATTSQSLGINPGISMSPQASEIARFVAPQEIFPPPQSLEPAEINYANVPPTVAEPPVTTPTVSKSSHRVPPNQAVQIVKSNQTAIAPIIYESTLLVTPVLESSQVATPDHTAHSAIVHESPHLVAPVFESSQTVTSGQVIVAPIVPESPHLVVPSPVLESSQSVTSGQVIVAPIVHESPSLVDPAAIGSSRPAAPQQAISQGSVSSRRLTDSPYAAQKSQPAAAPNSSDLVGDLTGGNSGATATTKGVYRLRDKATAATLNHTRRDSIEGVPDVTLSLSGSGYEVVNCSSQQESPVWFAGNNTNVSIPLATVPSTTPSTTPSSTPSPDEIVVPSSRQPSEYLTAPSATPAPDELVVPPSQQSLEEYLTIPTGVGMVDLTLLSEDEFVVPTSRQSEEPLTIPPGSKTAAVASRSFPFAPRIVPTYNIDQSDFPSWLLERGRLEYVMDVKAGDLWEKLITTWLRQERRLAFGMNEQLGANLSLKEKPNILKDYFKWHHNPSKGNSVALPEFGDEVALWWSSIQPKWRYKEGHFPDVQKDYSYILAGGKKGVFLLVLCLAWWDRAHGQIIGTEKTKRREAVGTGEAAIGPSSLRDHDSKWFNIVNDLIFVMEIAQGWPIPGGSTPEAVGAVPARRKRGAEQGGSSSPRKKKKP